MKTYLPLFPGFYNTVFEPYEESEIECINELRYAKDLEPVAFEDINFDYDTYFSEMSEDCCYKVAEFLEGILDTKVSIKKEKLIRPRFYNYSNDSVNIDIDIDLRTIQNYVINNLNPFEGYIEDRYTSRSGFISGYDNDHENWIRDLYSLDFDPSHKLGSILNFILENEGYTDFDLLDACSDCNNVYATNFDELTT